MALRREDRIKTGPNSANSEEAEAVAFARAEGLPRVFHRSADPDRWGGRYWAAARVLRNILRRAQAGDSSAKLLWERASGLNRRNQGRQVPKLDRWVRDQARAILEVKNATDRAELLAEFLESESDLPKLLGKTRRALLAFDQGRPRSKPLAEAIGEGEHPSDIVLRPVSKRECYVLLDLALDLSGLRPRDKRTKGALGERIRKWVAR